MESAHITDVLNRTERRLLDVSYPSQRVLALDQVANVAASWELAIYGAVLIARPGSFREAKKRTEWTTSLLDLVRSSAIQGSNIRGRLLRSVADVPNNDPHGITRMSFTSPLEISIALPAAFGGVLVLGALVEVLHRAYDLVVKVRDGEIEADLERARATEEMLEIRFRVNEMLNHVPRSLWSERPTDVDLMSDDDSS